VVLLTVLLAMYVAAPALYVLSSPRRHLGRSRRLLAAGGASLVAVGVALLILAVGAVAFGVELAVARQQDVSVGVGLLLAALPLGPIVLVVLGVLCARGKRAAAVLAIILCLLAYAVCAVRLLAVSSQGVDPSASDVLVPAAVGLIAPALLAAGLVRADAWATGSPSGGERNGASATSSSSG
jgi:hypothetical protein